MARMYARVILVDTWPPLVRKAFPHNVGVKIFIRFHRGKSI